MFQVKIQYDIIIKWDSESRHESKVSEPCFPLLTSRKIQSLSEGYFL